MSSNKLLINRSQRNLLLNSDFIKNEEPKIYAILSKYNKISYQIAKEEDITDKIKQNLSLWLDFSSKEWTPDKKNPRIGEIIGEEKRCQLCNTPIKYQYKIKNKRNDCVLIIGGNCVNTFQELKTMKKLVSNEHEFKRYNHLLDYNPSIYDILMTYTHILKRTKIILPNYYESSFKNIQKKILKILKAYIKNDKEFDKQELDRLIRIHKNEIENINKFVDEHVHDKNYLSRDRANLIKNYQKEDFQEILNEVKENGGKMLPSTSIKLKIESFLEEKKIDLVKVSPDYFVVERTSYGVYFVAIRKFNDFYKSSVSSRLLLNEYYKNKLKKIDNFYENNLDSFNVYDSDTQEKLVILAETFITKNRELKLKEIDFHKIVNRYDDDLSQQEYSELYERISNIVGKYTLIEKQGDAKLLIYNNTKLGNFGKNLLFHQAEREISTLLKSNETTMYVDEFYDFVISQIG